MQKNNKIENISKFANITKGASLCDTNISTRLFNILATNKVKLGINYYRGIKVEELPEFSISNFLQCHNAGEESLKELKEFCFYTGIKLIQ